MNIKKIIWFFIPILLHSANYSFCTAERFDTVLVKKKIEKILDTEPQNVQCLLQLANIYLKEGKIGIGFEILIEAYGIDSNIVKNSKIARILPFALHVTVLRHKANKTNRSFYWNKLADGYFDLGIMSEAIVSYRRSLKINPKQPKIRLKLSIAYKNIGQIYNCLDQIKEALKDNPQSFYANYYMGKILKNDFKELKNAKIYFKKAYNALIKQKESFKDETFISLQKKLKRELLVK